MEGGNEMSPWCSLQLAREMRPYTPSTEQKNDDLLKYVVKEEIIEQSWKLIRSAGNKEKCVEKMETDICFRRR